MVLNLLLIGLAVALDPLPLTSFVVVLPSKRGVRKGAAFLFGWLVSLAVVVAVTVLATGNNPPKPNTVPSLASLAVKIAIGTLLVWIAIRQRQRMRGPKQPKKPPKWQQHVDNMSPWFAMGLAPALQPWTLIAAGAATVLQAKLSSWESFLALIGFCILGSASYIAMEIYAGFWPDQSRAFLARFRTWMEAHTDRVIIIGCLLLGCWLIASSIYYVLRVLRSATRPASPCQRGRDHDVVPGRHGDYAARVAARDHHAGLDGQGQPVIAAPAQRGDRRPVSDPPRGVDPSEPVAHVRSARRAGQWHRTARNRPSRAAAAGAGAWDDGGTGRAVMAASRAGGGGAAGARSGAEDRPPRRACSSAGCFGEIAPDFVSEEQGLPIAHAADIALNRTFVL